MGYNEANAQLETTGMIPAPYIRVNRSISLTLSTTWQRIAFNGTSTRNTNEFPIMSSGRQLVEWNNTTNVFNFNNTIFRHYDVIFNYHINSSTLVSLLNLTMTTVQLRFVVPRSTADGGPRYFPLPDDGAQIDIAYTGLAADIRNTFNYIVRSVADVQQYGIGIEIRLAGTALGTITLSSTDMSLYGR